MFLLTMHPHYIGHRSRIVILEELIEYMNAKPGVWYATHRAAAEYAHVLRLAPDHADTLYNLGSLELARGRLDAAAGALSRLVGRDPAHVSALNALAIVRERQGDSAGAIALLRQALAAAPDHAPARRNLARLTGAPRVD